MALIIFTVVLSVLGGALIAGGLVGYRASRTAGGKVVSAAGIAAGLAMWAVILFVVPVSSGAGADESVQPSPSAEATAIVEPSSGLADGAGGSNGMTW